MLVEEDQGDLVNQLFSNLEIVRKAIAEQIVQQVRHRIDIRSRGPRNQANDDVQVFGPLNKAMYLALLKQDYQLAKEMFFECYHYALEYEQRKPKCEIHKGAPTFNMGLASLASGDFQAAMHFFEIAEKETQKTTGEKGWKIFLFDLFERNYWDRIDRAAQPGAYPLPLYGDLWGVPWSKETAMRNWRRLSGHTKLLFLINVAERFHYRRLIDESKASQSASIALAYWNLCSDLSRLLETEVCRRKKPKRPGNNGKFFNVLEARFKR